MAAVVAEAARDGTGMGYLGPRVHSGVARALRVLQSELHGVTPVRAHRTGYGRDHRESLFYLCVRACSVRDFSCDMSTLSLQYEGMNTGIMPVAVG